MRWPWQRRPVKRAPRSEDALRRMGEEVAARVAEAIIAAPESRDPVPVWPIVAEIQAREGLSIDELDRMCAHFSVAADAYVALAQAEPAGHA